MAQHHPLLLPPIHMPHPLPPGIGQPRVAVAADGGGGADWGLGSAAEAELSVSVLEEVGQVADAFDL